MIDPNHSLVPFGTREFRLPPRQADPRRRCEFWLARTYIVGFTAQRAAIPLSQPISAGRQSLQCWPVAKASVSLTLARCFSNPPGLLRLEPYSKGLQVRIWWGAGINATAVWAARLGMNLQSSTLKFDETGEPYHVKQANQIRAFRAASNKAGHTRTPRVSVSRSIFALVDNRDRAYFGRVERRISSATLMDADGRSLAGPVRPNRMC